MRWLNKFAAKALMVTGVLLLGNNAEAAPRETGDTARDDESHRSTTGDLSYRLGDFLDIGDEPGGNPPHPE